MNSESAGFEVEFDHVAIALERMTDGWTVFSDGLGGRYIDRGITDGYSWLQLKFANGFKLETLHPEENSEPPTGSHGAFVQRFLRRRGPGPHHLTFVVDDLDAAMASLSDAGLTPGTVDRSETQWQEALYGAAQAHGIILQVAQRDESLRPEQAGPPQGPPEGLVEPPFDHPMGSLSRVVHAVADIEGALTVYRDALGGTVHSSGAAVDGNHWAELGWNGAGRLRLLEATHGDLADWIGDRPGRLRHLYFSFDDPQLVPDAHKVAESRWAISNDSLGVRIVLASTAR